MTKTEFGRIQDDYIIADAMYALISATVDERINAEMKSAGYEFDTMTEKQFEEVDRSISEITAAKAKAGKEKKAAELALMKAGLAISPEAGISLEQLRKAPYVQRQRWLECIITLNPDTIPDMVMERASAILAPQT